ncbi:MAG: MCE family protein [Flavobacterium sp.]|nr:MAG: MCE family protein [Flavobacterium sp.]
MNTQSPNFKIRLGIFISIGLLLFALAIFVIGKQKNLFDPVFTLHTRFTNVSGLQVGNAVRFSGINVGTVDKISIVNDTLVQVSMLVQKSVQKFIKEDSEAGIGSEGLIGDRLVSISNGGVDSKSVKDGQVLASNEPVETDAIMQSLEITAGNAAVMSEDLSEILNKVNNGQGTLGRLINDEKIARNLDATMTNLKTSTKKLDENMEAAKHNFLLKGYFKKKEKAEQKKKEEEQKKKEEAEKKAKEAQEKKAADKASKK